MAVEGHPVQWVTIALGSCDGSLLNSQPKAPREWWKDDGGGPKCCTHTHTHRPCGCCHNLCSASKVLCEEPELPDEEAEFLEEEAQDVSIHIVIVYSLKVE